VSRQPFLEPFRDPERVHALADKIRTVTRDRSVTLMEVCGGHTHAVYRYGLHDLLPDTVTLLHGPGCPVCVMPMSRIDVALSLAEQPGVIFTTFADMMRVPGTRGSLLDARARGADVRFVYSPLDALQLARSHPDREVIFYAIGFETTAPSTAVTVLRARSEGLRNFSVYCNHVRVTPALRALLEAPDTRLDGFIGPGHVSTVIGFEAYRFIPEEFGKAVVVAGFEPTDILQAVYMAARQVVEGRPRVENQYVRVVTAEGNRAAQAAIDEVMAVRPTFTWRGLGAIPDSAYRLREAYRDWDAEARFAVPERPAREPRACQCGDVLRGLIQPWECRVFGTACTPEHPLGACMVSPEGACSAYYQYGRGLSLARE
jgi:hydrogenase expression/formation protein HypD